MSLAIFATFRKCLIPLVFIAVFIDSHGMQLNFSRLDRNNFQRRYYINRSYLIEIINKWKFTRSLQNKISSIVWRFLTKEPCYLAIWYVESQFFRSALHWSHFFPGTLTWRFRYNAFYSIIFVFFFFNNFFNLFNFLHS